MALRAGSVGLGREAGLGARRGWTRRRPPPPPPAGVPARRGSLAAGGPAAGAAAATLDARRALPVDRPSCGGRRPPPSLPVRLPAPPRVGRGAPSPPLPSARRAPGPVRSRGRPERRRVGGVGGGGRRPARPRRRSRAGRSRAGGVPGPAPRLGRRLAAGLELVRTRGIRLFN